MKRLITVFLIVIATHGYSQDSEVGIKGGLNLSNFHSNNSEVDDNNLRVGYNAGVYFHAELSDVFAIQPEVLYTTKGSTYDYDLGILGNADVTTKFNYLQVPVLGMITIFDAVSVHAGPYVGYMLSATNEVESDGNFSAVNELNEEDFNRIDYGLSVGAGLDIESLRLGARYDYGMSELGDDGDIGALSGSRNSVWQLYLGIGF